MEKESVTLHLKGDNFKDVMDTLERHAFDANSIGDQLDEAFSMYLYGEHENDTDDCYRAHWVFGAVVDAKKIIRAIAEVAKYAK
jgi:hypothetical protein